MTSQGTSTSPRRPLHYGDLIYLSTSGGSVGNFYPFSSINNLLLLDHESSLESAQAMWCTFRILPPYQFKDQAALKKELNRPQKDWVTISNLEKQVHNETVDNKKRFVRSLSRTVRYLQELQLEHVATRRFLGHTSSRTSSTEDRNFPCCLEDIPSKKTVFKMWPVIPGTAAGDTIYSCDVVNIFTDPDGFVRHSLVPCSAENGFYPARPEINVGPIHEGFKISLHHQMIQNGDLKITSWEEADLNELLEPVRLVGSSLIQLTKSGTEMRVVLDTNTGTGTNLALKHVPTQRGRHNCSAVETFWVLEHDSPDGGLNGDLITDSTPVRLRHFVTGEFARLPGNGKYIKILAALEDENTDRCFKNGSHVKLATDKGFLGALNHDSTTIICKEEFDFNDTMTVRKVDSVGKCSAMKILGLKLLLKKIIALDGQNGLKLSTNNHGTIIQAIKESAELLSKRSDLAEDFLASGITEIVEMLFDIAQLYSNAKNDAGELTLCLNAVCKLLNQLSRWKSFACFEKRTSDLISTLIGDDLKIAEQLEYVEDQDVPGSDQTKTVVSPLNSLLAGSPYLLSGISKKQIMKLVGLYERPQSVKERTSDNNGDRADLKKREIAKVLCSLCRVRGKTIPLNQKIISEQLFKDETRSPALLKHVVKDNEIYYEGKSLKEITSDSNLYADLLSQLRLYECLLFGRKANKETIKEKIVSQHNMFTLAECVYVIRSSAVDSNVKGWYIQILIAAYVDTGYAETKIIPHMLTFQYEENIHNRANLRSGSNQRPPDKEADLFQKLLQELENFLRRNATCTVNDPDSRRGNMYRYHMMRLLEYMFRAGKINFQNVSKFITPLISFLDGTNDMYSGKSPNSKNERTFQEIFRFKALEVNLPVFDIKKRALRVLYYSYEQALFDYWTQVMLEVYSTVKSYDKNKETWLSQISNFLGKLDMETSFHEVIVEAFENPEFDVTSKDFVHARNTVKGLLLSQYKSIELFSHMDEVVRVLLDTMRYEDHSLCERAMQLLVMIRSPTNRLLELLPKSSITISKTEFSNRHEIVENVAKFLKIAREELSLESRDKISTVLQEIELSLREEKGKVYKSRQRLLYDLDIVPEVISLLCEPMSNLITRSMTDSDLQGVAESVDRTKCRAFSLLRLLVSGHPPAQNTAMKHFTQLVSISGEAALPNGELEVARVLALNEVFTANTNLSIKVNDSILQAIFDKLLSLVNVTRKEEMTENSQATYRYLELLENILDLEESDQVLYKLQANILRFIRDHWIGLNGSLQSNKGKVSLDLLNPRKKRWSVLEGDDWKGLYFVEMLSLMAVCASGSLKSSLTICKELIPYSDLKVLVEESSDNAVQFKSLLKFLFNVYVKSPGQLKRAAMVCDVLKCIESGEKFIEELYSKLLEGNVATKLERLSSIRDFVISLKLLTEGGEIVLMDLLDGVFNAVLPLIAEVYKNAPAALLNENGGIPIAAQLSVNLRNLLRLTSNFLNGENFTMLLSAVRAVNGYNPEKGPDLEIIHEGEVWRINSSGVGERVLGILATGNEDIIVKDVMDLKRKQSLHEKMLTMEEQNRVNTMFQQVVKIIRKAVKSDVPDRFFTKSDELEILGKTILGVLGVEDSPQDQQTLVEVVYSAPTNAVYGAKDLVLDTIQASKSSSLLTYQDDELWRLVERICTWLRGERVLNVFIVKQLLNSITLQLEKLRAIQDVGQEVVYRLLNAGFVETLCSLISRNSAAQPALTCLSCLLQFHGAQKQMLQVCKSNEEPIFEWVWDQIDTAVSGYIQFNMARNVMLSAARPIIDIDTATPHMRLSVQFLGRLSNKTSKLQDYLRSQDNKVVSHNFLTALLNLLKTIPEHDLIGASSNCKKRMRQHNKMIVDTLTSLVDMLSTNTRAKEYAIEMGIIESIDRLLQDIQTLETSNSGSTEYHKTGLVSVTVEEILRIRINCYDVLITLLEYDQNLLDVGEKIWLLVDLRDYGMSDNMEKCGEGNLTSMVEIPNFPGGTENKSVCISRIFSSAHDILGGIHLLSTILLAATYAITNFHRFDHPSFNWRAFIFGKSSEQAYAHKPTISRMKISYTSFYNFWLLVMIVCSALGIQYNGQLYCVHLMHIVAMFDLLTRVIKGATANRDQLLVIIPFAVFIIYIYSMIFFTFTREMFLNSNMEYCDSLAECFSTAIRYSMRNSNGGHNYSWTNRRTFTDMWIRIAMDASFWLFYSIIGLKVVTALVLDGFTSQKKLRETSLEDMSSVCTVCGITKDEFAGKGIDWDTHIKQEHNLWSYISLFYYLTTNKRKLSAIEDEVLQKFRNKDITFLPRKTSLSWRSAVKQREEMRKKAMFI
ncbi:hypothetical protein ACHWQZ_G006275 [Mnemiopsis leidyi]